MPIQVFFPTEERPFFSKPSANALRSAARGRLRHSRSAMPEDPRAAERRGQGSKAIDEKAARSLYFVQN